MATRGQWAIETTDTEWFFRQTQKPFLEFLVYHIGTGFIVDTGDSDGYISYYPKLVVPLLDRLVDETDITDIPGVDHIPNLTRWFAS